MNHRSTRHQALAWAVFACTLPGVAAAQDDDRRRLDLAQMHRAANSGVAVTISTNGFIDRRNPVAGSESAISTI